MRNVKLFTSITMIPLLFGATTAFAAVGNSVVPDKMNIEGQQGVIPGEGGSFNFINGDVLVTDSNRSTSYNYGHAAIFVGNGNTAEAWPSYEGGIQFKSTSSWTSLSRYAVLRPLTGGSSAATWATNAVNSRYYQYDLGAPMTEQYKTYCSKFVWQSYLYGANVSIPYNFGTIMPKDIYNSTKFTKVYDSIKTWQ